MYKKFLLRCSVLNHYEGWWDDREFYFDTEEDMIDFIKNGSKEIKSEDIRVAATFELKRLIWG